MVKKKIHLYSSIMPCACGHIKGAETTKNHDEVTCNNCLQTVNLCKILGKQWLDEEFETIDVCEDCEHSDECNVPDYVVVGEIIRLIDCIDDARKLGVVYKYAQVQFNMMALDELKESMDNEDKDKDSQEVTKEMMKDFIERL